MRGGADPGSDKPEAQTPVMQLSFDRYVLDLSRGCLLLNGNEVRLRPKTFAVLRFLIENAGASSLRTKSLPLSGRISL